MTDTPNLGLPLLAAAQAQKHVTHNEALLAIDALLHCAVLDRDLAGPPASPAEGARYIVAAAPSGAWAGRAGALAIRQDGGWRFVAPQAGFVAYVVDEGLLCVFDGAGWTTLAAALGAIQELARLGIGTTADAANPFAAKLNNALWTARTGAEGGSGDLRYVLNKEGAANVVSLLFQTGSSGRFELGLVGSDNPSLRVSPDGTTWRDAVRIDNATGGLDFLAAEGSIASFGGRRHAVRLVRFADALTLQHDPATLVLPGGTDIATAPGDTLLAVSDGSGHWRVAQYGRASGRSLVLQTAAELGVGTGSAAAFASVSAPLHSVDATFLSALSGSRPYIQFDGGDFIIFDRAADSLDVYLNNAAVVALDAGRFRPVADNATDLGAGASRWAVVYAGTGTINTSDERDKEAPEPLSGAEIEASRELARAIGTFRYLDAIARKGEGARRHVGLTVQRAAAILERHGLDPFRYGFMCHDRWDATPPTQRPPAATPSADPGGEAAALDRPAIPGSPGRPAGDRYGFRPDQLALFIARGQEARLAALEAGQA